MPYVTRAADGTIASLHREKPAASAEFLAPEAQEVIDFVGAGNEDFGRLDADSVRVIEDVTDTLIVRDVINVTDLPELAQAKLFARKSFRERVTRDSLRLFDDSGASDVIGDTQFGTP